MTMPGQHHRSLRPWLSVPCRIAAVLLLCSMLIRESNGSNELMQYVLEPDASYSWRVIRCGRIGSADYTEAILTSQTWRGITWKHQLFLIRPGRLDLSGKQAFLFIDGGHWDAQYENGSAHRPSGEAGIFVRLASLLRAPVAIVRQVPFEPLFGRSEDALIAYSFQQYFNTREADWPLLLPMVKSASRAMDAVQELARELWHLQVLRFTITGASKRGWTAWLTAAVDSRVASVAPMVIDMLNIPAQIELQRQTFGGLSEKIHDYEEIGLPDRIDSPAGRELVSIVDPYSYRDDLTQPKLILLGTNDPYWPLDALKLYWGRLPEEKRVLYLSNQTHSLRDADRLLATLAALHRYSSQGKPLPSVSGTFSKRSDAIELTVRTDRRPRRVIAWSATSSTRDFRQAHWSSRACKPAGHDYICYICQERIADERYTALYAEASFEADTAPAFSLSTTVCIAGGPNADRAGC